MIVPNLSPRDASEQKTLHRNEQTGNSTASLIAHQALSCGLIHLDKDRLFLWLQALKERCPV